MASPTVVALPKELQEDDRDVSDLWKQALQNYKGIVGFDLERKFDNVEAMVSFGTEQMNNFHRFRHDQKKVDKLRSIFKDNLDLLEMGAQQLISAATPAFPPAAAIGTAMTWILQACRSLSADYDVVVVFFDDMNSFLQRIIILETRLPAHKAYQNCLMDVFNSFLSMCGFAHKYIVLGRFKKWITNLFEGQDPELAGARKTMETSLNRLQNATEFAILGNTEETKKMTQELQENARLHALMLEEQREVLGSIQETAQNTHSDVQKILKLMSSQGLAEIGAPPQATDKPPLANSIRNALFKVDADDHEYTVLGETMVPNTCSWLFTEPAWGTWMKKPVGQRPVLVVFGAPGTGKSHLALAVHDKLQEVAEDGTAIGHFYFREQQSSFKRFLCGIVTVINQIAEKDAKLCEKINSLLMEDTTLIDRSSWRSLVEVILSPIFSELDRRLWVVFDGLDELQDANSFGAFAGMVQNLNISIVVTCREDRLSIIDGLDTVVIRLDKEKQLTDLKALTWHRMKGLSNLRNFSPYVQARIADRIVEVSPNMLYVEHMLARLNRIGREGAVLQLINNPMPGSVQHLYSSSLDECQRRMIPKHQHVASMLLHYLAFARREMTLDEVVSLLRNFSGDDNFNLEEIPEILSRFLSIGDPVELESRRTPRHHAYSLSSIEKGQDDIYDDGKLPVKFQERSMRDFFRNLKDENKLYRWGESEAQRKMFLAAIDIAQPAPEGTVSKFHPKLQSYAAEEIFSHWVHISPGTHTTAQQAEAMEALALVMSNKTGLAEMLSRLPMLFYADTYDNTGNVNRKIMEWIELFEQNEVREQLSESATLWWSKLTEDPRRLRLGLAKGFLSLLYQAPDKGAARKQFQLCRNVLRRCGLQNLLLENAQKLYPERTLGKDDVDEALVLGVIRLFEEVPMDDRAYRAVAEIVSNYHPDISFELCQTALTLNQNDTVERCKILILLARLHMEAENLEKAAEAVGSCIPYIQDEIPVALKQNVWITKAAVDTKLGNSSASASYRAARAVDPNTMVPGDCLVKELFLFVEKDDKVGYMETLKSWTPLERLAWFTWRYAHTNEIKQHYIRDCAVILGEEDFVISVYREIVGYMDKLNASVPIKVDMAQTYLQVLEDNRAARAILEEVADSHCNGYPWAITGEDPQDVLPRLLSCMTDILFAQFYESRDPKVKTEAYEALKGLMQRPLFLDIPIYSSFVLLNYRNKLAMMSLKLGNAVEFQSTLQSNIDNCMEALTDNTFWNDCFNLIELGRAVAVLSRSIRSPHLSQELHRCARILNSAMYSRLDITIDDEVTRRLIEMNNISWEGVHEDTEGIDEGDLMPSQLCTNTCDGACRPIAKYTRWGDRGAYMCLLCSTVFLCEECHALRQDVTKWEGTPVARN
ncbi:hypothetical protein B0I35DRAFT_357885 [Stachybotrys elegans]|uniref:Fungal STAND N-terminal Goodbye domain-containing protein n=1 Tax=Stachybotrys elegans TaxID=80388 RepID=A0A8K0SNT2_9HYPO|nr:hypothetical protein B0I35DRAFT_357885 [Stachybotrys elegans]